MLTRTAFNPSLLSKIEAAMRHVVGLSRENPLCYKASTCVLNRRGRWAMRVAYYRGQTGAWEFFDNRNRDITHLVLAALRQGE